MTDVRRSLAYRLLSEGSDLASLRYFLDHPKVSLKILVMTTGVSTSIRVSHERVGGEMG